jgi:hypothetical protein
MFGFRHDAVGVCPGVTKGIVSDEARRGAPNQHPPSRKPPGKTHSTASHATRDVSAPRRCTHPWRPGALPKLRGDG